MTADGDPSGDRAGPGVSRGAQNGIPRRNGADPPDDGAEDELPEPGDSVRLKALMNDPYATVSAGDSGTVERVEPFHGVLAETASHQIWVDWHDGGNFALLEGVDEYEVIGDEDSPDTDAANADE